MDKLIRALPSLLQEAIAIGKAQKFDTFNNPINAVCISGLGGSGIGGDYIRLMVKSSCIVPIVVHRDYNLPAFVNKATLCIFSSYSGNTEETLASLDTALSKDTNIIGISSGGKLREMGKQHNFHVVNLPEGFAPRAALAYSIIQQLYILSAYNLISKEWILDLNNLPDYINSCQEEIMVKAKTIAQTIGDSLPIIYTTSDYEPLAIRLRQQLNENSKILCWHHVAPELNHNEIVGWTQAHADKKVIFILDENIDPKLKKHTDFLQNIVGKLCEATITINPKGINVLQKYFYATHLVDWISYYLALLRQVDAMQVNVINQLKKSLQK